MTCQGHRDAALVGTWGFGVQVHAPTREDPDFKVATLNVANLTLATWGAVVERLKAQGVHMCAIQDLGIWSTAGLDQTDFKLWRNPGGRNSAGGVRAGVGWMIHKSVLDKVARCNGPMEGEHAMWVQTKAGTAATQWASFYNRPGDDGTREAFITAVLEAHLAAPHRALAILGDVNCNTAEDTPAARQWASLFEATGMRALDQVGRWADVPTRFPWGTRWGARPTSIW